MNVLPESTGAARRIRWAYFAAGEPWLYWNVLKHD